MDTRTVRRITIEHKSPHDKTDPNQVTIDIFPHRLAPRAGFTVNDMVQVVVGMMFARTYSRGVRLSPRATDELAAVGLDHPVGRFSKGAVVVVDGIDPDGEHWVLDGETITFPDGTARQFDGLFPEPCRYYRRHTFAEMVDKMMGVVDADTMSAVATGFVLEAMPIPYGTDKVFKTAKVVAARAATLIDLGLAPGKVGREKAVDQVDDDLREMKSSWVFMPDRMLEPRNYTPLPQLLECLSEMDTVLIDVGREIMRNLPDGISGEDERAAVEGDDEELSNHKRLLLSAQLSALDQVIEDAAPLHLLKPAARKRREKRNR